MNTAEAGELAAAARAHPDRIALIDHELRFLPSWREARARMAGEIGDVRYPRCGTPVRLVAIGAGGWNWWSDATRGGGVWGAVGSHFVDALRYFGMEIESAHALMRSTIETRPFGDATRAVTSDDFASVDLRLRGGAVATLLFSAVAAGPTSPALSRSTENAAPCASSAKR